MKIITNWFDSNSLMLNLSKSKYIICRINKISDNLKFEIQESWYFY